MTKSELWGIYCRKNPKFAEEGEITLTTKGLRKMFDVTWDTAFYDGEDEPCSPKEQSSASVETLMKVFGMKP
jgi:predicted nucleic-acid-binding Zn-ribbon protein